MVLLIYLWAAHTILDFFCQTNWMAVNKSHSSKALLAHVGVYSAGIALATLSLAFAAVTFVAHFITDWVTSRITSRQWPYLHQGEKVYDIEGYYGNPIYIPVGIGPLVPVWIQRSRHGFFCTIGVDQWLHFAQLALTAWWLGWVG